MFEAHRAVEVPDLTALVARLAHLDRTVTDAVRVDRIRALEDLKNACAAAQARDAADLYGSQRQEQAAAGVPADQLGRGVAAQVALARRDSPHRGGRHLGLARALVDEMPHTLAALSSGRLSEWRATLMVRETAALTREHRTAVDAEVLGSPAALRALDQLGDRALVARAKQAAYRLDPRSVVERARRAEGERCVTVRPAPDTMAYLTALLPVRDAVATQVALGRAADSARNAGDPRTRGQLMADTLVAAVAAGRPEDGDRTRPGPEDLALRLVMTDRTLLDGGDEPAHLEGYGPVPAGWARDLVLSCLTEPDGRGAAPAPGRAEARVFVKRLLTDTGGALVAMDSRARLAPTGLAAFIRTRDAGTCRTPWCDAPARHIDHVDPYARGGATDARNGQGLCVACNLTKEVTGWRSVVVDPAHEGDGAEPSRHTVDVTTPTGHTYRSVAPPLPGTRPPDDPLDPLDPRDASTSVYEDVLRELLTLAV